MHSCCCGESTYNVFHIFVLSDYATLVSEFKTVKFKKKKKNKNCIRNWLKRPFDFKLDYLTHVNCIEKNKTKQNKKPLREWKV